MDKTNFLRKYRLASQFTTPQMDSYDYETISKICVAILEAAILKEELKDMSNGEIVITLTQALSKIESEKFHNTPKIKQYFPQR